MAVTPESRLGPGGRLVPPHLLVVLVLVTGLTPPLVSGAGRVLFPGPETPSGGSETRSGGSEEAVWIWRGSDRALSSGRGLLAVDTPVRQPEQGLQRRPADGRSSSTL